MGVVIYCFYYNQLLSFMLFTVSLFLLLFTYNIFCENESIQGRYTRELSEYHLVIPRKVDHRGNFLSYKLPKYYTRDYKKRRKRQSNNNDNDKIHYHLEFDGLVHHLELIPNHGLLSPDAIIEENAGDKRNIKARYANQKQCHYTGIVRDVNNSKVAISLCDDGLAGSVYTDRGQYLVEPVHEHGANTLGHHLHVVHRRGKGNHATTKVRDAASKYRAATESTHYKECGSSNWEQGWANSFRYKYEQENNDIKDRDAIRDENKNESLRDQHKRQLILSSKHYFLEVMIVADKKFLQYHKDTDYESYLLTIMNMVSNFYHDGSLGQSFDIVITRIMYLNKEEEEIDLDINPDADSTLESFCAWSKKVNLNEEHPNHYDVAALVTRHNICVTEDDSSVNCGLLGIAEVSGACRPGGACSVNQDSGLELGVVITHEIGHLLGSNHDDPSESECDAEIPDMKDYYHVMSPFIRVATIQWSPCSKAFVKTLVNTGLGTCMENEPREARYKPIDILPGVVYDADFQCRQLGLGLPSCMGVDCEHIRCYLDKEGGSCGSYPTIPTFDGTECGTNKWCIRSECVEKGSRPKAVDGGWSEWTSISECSRTCGGGVQFQKRECNNPVPTGGGKYCVGDRKKYFICNTQHCNSKSFKDFQCSKLNKDGKEYISYSSPRQQTNTCKLYCLLKPAGPLEVIPAADGTKCKPGTKNVCIQNKCQKVGCDWIFGSASITDRCGVCKGDGSTCSKVKEKFTTEPTGTVTVMFEIPANVRSIHIKQINDDSEGSWLMLATVQNGSPTVVLGSVRAQENDTQMDIVGSSLIYTHQRTGKENLWIYDPIKDPLKIYLSAPNLKNPGYKMSYMVPVPQDKSQRKFSWEITEFTVCSVRCGGGTQESIPTCVDDVLGKVDNSNCKEPKPEIISRPCNMRPCKTKWRVGEWGMCTGCRNRLGFKRREVLCIKESKRKDADDEIQDAEACKKKKPHRLELCMSMRPCDNVVRRDSYIDEETARKLWHQVQKHRKRSHEYKQKKSKNYVFRLLENYDPYLNGMPRINDTEDLIECSAINGSDAFETGTTRKLTSGKVVKDYQAKDNLATVAHTTKNVPFINLNEKNFEEQGADILIEGSTEEAKSESATELSVIDKNTLSANNR